MGSVQMIAEGVASGVSAQIATQRAKDTTKAETERVGAVVQEGERQKQSVTDQTRAQKSDRIRQADKAMGAMIASMADNGAMGTSTVGRFGGEIDYLAEIDVDRLEKNRIEQLGAINAETMSEYQVSLNIITQAHQAAMGQWMSHILASAEATADQTQHEREKTKTTGTDKPSGGGSDAPRRNMGFVQASSRNFHDF